ncbi:MAG: S8 family serine peptidase, partial [Planctomycetota bacterium]|nr:S8 family serine peptidase [Planctomycetota bacterium]
MRAKGQEPAATGVQAKSWPQWGGALNSAQSDGVGFFNRARAREFAGSVAPELKKYIVDLNARAFLPLPGPENAAEALADEPAKRAQDDRPTTYLQFIEHPSSDQRAQLTARGLELLAYVSGYAWTARGTKEAFGGALKLDFVRAVARVDPRDKLHPQVFGIMRGSPSPSYALADDGRTRFRLLAAAGTTRDALLKQYDALADLELAPADVRAAPQSVLGPRFEVVARHDLAQQLAEASAVAFVELVPQPVASRDATTDLESNITDVRDSGPLLDGTGVTVAVREIGNIDAHLDFNARLQRIEATGSTNATDVDHATAVTGQIGSNGVVQPTAKGVAPNVSLLGYVVTLGGSPETFATTDILDAAAKGARISNHSYGPTGISTWGDYGTISADWDAALRNGSLIACFAGNEEVGGQSNHIDYFVGAKNGICVSATDANARAGNAALSQAPANGIATFSEYGPMNDGRVKPDLVAFGDGVALDQGTNSVQSIKGTSFATPAVTGVAARAFQRYKAVVGAEASGQLMKALLCNSATDLGTPGPDPRYGFGIVNASAAIATVNLRQSAASTPFLEDTVTNGVTKTFTVNLQNAISLKATLCWLDVAGPLSPAKALVNDLDLTIVGPDGTTYYPYSLDPTKPLAPATNTGPNTVDPIEQIAVAFP